MAKPKDNKGLFRKAGVRRKVRRDTVKGRTRHEKIEFHETPPKEHNFKAQLCEAYLMLALRK